MKELRCGDVMVGCDHIVRGKSVHEVMARGAQHARDAHGIDQIDAETAEKVRAAIHDA